MGKIKCGCGIEFPSRSEYMKHAVKEHPERFRKNPIVKAPETPKAAEPKAIQEKPQTEAISEPEKIEEKPKEQVPESNPETITIQNEYSEVPKIDGELKEAPKAEAQAALTEDDRFDLTGIEDFLIDIVDTRFKDKGLKQFTEDERAKIRKYSKAMIAKYANYYFKYALEVNFALAIALPLGARVIEAKTKNKAAKGETKEQIQEAARQETEQEKAMREYERLRGDGA